MRSMAEGIDKPAISGTFFIKLRSFSAMGIRLRITGPGCDHCQMKVLPMISH